MLSGLTLDPNTWVFLFNSIFSRLHRIGSPAAQPFRTCVCGNSKLEMNLWSQPQRSFLHRWLIELRPASVVRLGRTRNTTEDFSLKTSKSVYECAKEWKFWKALTVKSAISSNRLMSIVNVDRWRLANLKYEVHRTTVECDFCLIWLKVPPWGLCIVNTHAATSGSCSIDKRYLWRICVTVTSVRQWDVICFT